MHSRLAELVAYITAQRSALFLAVGQISELQRDDRIISDSWSVAEVLEHLHRVEKGISRLVSRSIERARSNGLPLEHDTESLLGGLDSFGLLQRGQRIPTPEPVMPRGELNAQQGLAALKESRRALLAAIEEGDGFALSRISYAHPVFGMLNLYQWILFVGQHEARHAAQISDLARVLGQPGRRS